MIRSRRTKPRPGRLKGAELEALRAACYDRDKGTCQGCGQWTIYNPYSHMQKDGYHMAHIKAKRIGLDVLSNVRVLCCKCHSDSHNAGGKPCPAKPK